MLASLTWKAWVLGWCAGVCVVGGQIEGHVGVSLLFVAVRWKSGTQREGLETRPAHSNVDAGARRLFFANLQCTARKAERERSQRTEAHDTQGRNTLPSGVASNETDPWFGTFPSRLGGSLDL